MPIKEIVSKTYELGQAAMDSIELLQRGFIYNNMRILDDMRDITARVEEAGGELVREFRKEKEANPVAAFYENVPSHLGQMALKLDEAARNIASKVGQGILFSDKTVDEVNFLLEKLKDILSNTNDMILARNNIIAGYIKEAEADILRVANDFQTKHEELVIEGQYPPEASSLYLHIVDAVKSAAWHAKEIAQELRGQ